MLTLTNFEDLLEKIKNITTPYEYYSIKEIYEKKRPINTRTVTDYRK